MERWPFIKKLDELGYEDKPHVSTIQRVLERNNLIEHKERTNDPTKPKIYYPDLRAQHPGHIHELDLVTPRYITGYAALYPSTVLMCIWAKRILTNTPPNERTASSNLSSMTGKTLPSRSILSWTTRPLSAALIHARTFGKLTRFCLNFGVQVIFIPFSEPWRNPYIESFNSRFNDRLLDVPKVYGSESS